LGIYLNGIKGGPLYPEIARMPFSEDWSLLEEMQDSVERDRRSLMNAKDVSGGYPSGNVDATVTEMNGVSIEAQFQSHPESSDPESVDLEIPTPSKRLRSSTGRGNTAVRRATARRVRR
jgi:hypothetical protein